MEQAYSEKKLRISPEEAGWDMMKSQDFQNTKCEYGGLDDFPIFSVPIPSIDATYENSGVGITNGEMQFTR